MTEDERALLEEARRGLDRRTVLLRGIAAGISLPALGAIVAACGDSGDGSSSATTAAAPTTAEPASSEAPATSATDATDDATTEDASSAAPETAEPPASEPAESGVETLPRGGVLSFSSESDPGRIETNLWGDIGFAVGYAVFDRLWETDGVELRPGLATALPDSADGTRYRIVLREGVTFHDGSPLTAEDVRYSIERQTLPANASDAQGSFAALGITGTKEFVDGTAKQLDGIVVVDDLTLEILLDAPNGSLPYWLTMPMAGIISAAYARQVGDEEFEKAPVGTGPYRLTSYEPGKAIVLDRYEGYWQPGVGNVDRVEWTIGINPELAILRVESGEQDLMFEAVPTAQVNEFRSRPNYAEAAYSDCFYVTNSLIHEATQDLRVRQAIHHAIDKDKLVRQLAGLGETARGGLFSPLSPYWQGAEEGFPQYFFDQEKAKALMAEAGFGDGFDLTIHAANEPPTSTIGKAVEADLNAVGIRATLDLKPLNAWLEIVLENPPAMVVSRWELPYPHGSYVIDSAFLEATLEGCCNFSRYTSPEVEQLATEARTSTDPAAQVALYRQLDRMLIGDEVLWVPLFYPKYAALVGQRVLGYTVPASPSGGTKYFARYAVQS